MAGSQPTSAATAGSTRLRWGFRGRTRPKYVVREFTPDLGIASNNVSQPGGFDFRALALAKDILV
jgi:hypothetical protein